MCFKQGDRVLWTPELNHQICRGEICLDSLFRILQFTCQRFVTRQRFLPASVLSQRDGDLFLNSTVPWKHSLQSLPCVQRFSVPVRMLQRTSQFLVDFQQVGFDRTTCNRSLKRFWCQIGLAVHDSGLAEIPMRHCIVGSQLNRSFQCCDRSRSMDVPQVEHPDKQRCGALIRQCCKFRNGGVRSLPFRCFQIRQSGDICQPVVKGLNGASGRMKLIDTFIGRSKSWIAEQNFQELLVRLNGHRFVNWFVGCRPRDGRKGTGMDYQYKDKNQQQPMASRSSSSEIGGECGHRPNDRVDCRWKRVDLRRNGHGHSGKATGKGRGRMVKR